MLSQQQTGDIPLALHVIVLETLRQVGVKTTPIPAELQEFYARCLNAAGEEDLASEVALNLEVSCGDSSS